MAPRTLEPVSVPQLTLWGLRGLTAIDPLLITDFRSNRLVVLHAEETLLALVPPDPNDTAGWGSAAASLAEAAWIASSTARQVGEQAIISNFFDELFNHLDPYSRYVPPAEAQADRDQRSGEAGIGLSLVLQSGRFIVSSVSADGPADLASIKVGDRVISIDGAPLPQADVTSAIAALLGPEGSLITLGVRSRDGRTRSLQLDRSMIPPETVFAERNADLLVMRISGFNRSTDQRISNELARGLRNTRLPHGLVLDLRGNRGGLLRQAVASASLLLAHGLIATTAGRDPEANHEFRVDGIDRSNQLPLVVLVDGRSASAAEVVAASLADNRRAVVVGSSTLGKGLVQTIAPLPDNGELFVTWSRIIAPFGWPLQGLGVLPANLHEFGARCARSPTGKPEKRASANGSRFGTPPACASTHACCAIARSSKCLPGSGRTRYRLECSPFPD